MQRENTSSSSKNLEFAARVRELLGDESGVSFAKNCGFSEGMLRKYLKGHEPGMTNFVAIANYRNVTLDWLATGVEPKFKPKKLRD